MRTCKNKPYEGTSLPHPLYITQRVKELMEKFGSHVRVK